MQRIRVKNIQAQQIGASNTPAQEIGLGNAQTINVFDLPIATTERLGAIQVGSNLKINENGVLSVDTANAVEQDNTKPITSAAVHVQLGNIEALLAAL